MTGHHNRGKKWEWILLFTFLFCFQLPGNAEAELQTEKPVFDFGTIQEGTNVPVHFTVENSGSKKLVIREIRTFAACVQSLPLKENVLDPGESVRLEYVFASLGYGGADIDKVIEVHYNNRKKSPLRMTVKGKVLPLETFQSPLGEIIYNFYILIDIRSEAEFREEHILGAIHVPRTELAAWIKKAEQNLSEDIIIYLCSEDGIESDKAAALLQKKGYPQFLSIVGGLKEWKRRFGKKLLISGDK